MFEKVLTLNETADACKRHPETIKRWLRSGKLTGVKLGRSWLISHTEVERALKEGLLAS